MARTPSQPNRRRPASGDRSVARGAGSAGRRGGVSGARPYSGASYVRADAGYSDARARADYPNAQARAGASGTRATAGSPSPATRRTASPRTPEVRSTRRNPPAAGRRDGARTRRPQHADPSRGGRPAPNAVGRDQRKAAKAPERPKSRYIPALDGLRAFAVLAVIAYHMGMPWAKGGLLGVTVFFVLSGYLITSLLVIEFQGTGRINLPDFWLRRVRRLFPAIVFAVVCVAVLCTIFNHALLTKLRPDVIPSLFFFNNWWQIFHNVSYFDALGSPSPVTHFWSLAIEEQFYLVWPVLLFILMKLGVRKRALSIMTLVLALLSAIDMAVLFDPHGDPSRVYYGTDTRAFSLLIGAWLAFVWPSHQLGATDSVHVSRRARWALDGVGLAAFVGLFLMVWLADGFSSFLYRGGLVLCSVLTAVVIAVMVHPASLLGRFWGLAPFVWIGKRSYGIYLWHYPLLLLMLPQNGIAESPWWMMLLALVAIFACSAFSYTFVENPIRHGAIGALLSDIANRRTTLQEWFRTHVVHAVAGTLLVLVAIGGLIFVPDTSALEGGDLLKDESAQIGGPTAGDLANSEQQASESAAKLDVLMIGDSVSVRAIPNFQEAFPYGAIDAAVNRQLYVGQEVYQAYADQNIVGNGVVFALGTNGVATDDQLDGLIAAVGSDKHIWFVNTRSPQSWMAETNDALARAADRYDNVELIDWYGLSAPHGDWFDGDGTHLSEAGAQAYIDMIRGAIEGYLPAHEEGDEHARLKSDQELALDNARDALGAAAPATLLGGVLKPIL